MNPIHRAIGSLFPKDASKIQNPLRRGAVQGYNRMMDDPTVQFMLRGSPPEQIQAQMRQMGAPEPRATSPHGEIRALTGRERVAQAVNRVIPKPVQQAARIIGDPLEMVDQPLGAGKAIMGARTRAKELGLVTERFGQHGVNYIHVKDPKLQSRYVGRKGVDPFGGRDAHGIEGGTIGAYINYEKHPRISEQGQDMFQLETGLKLKEKPPSYYVNYAKTLERPNPKFPGDPYKNITVEPAYTSEAFEDLLKVGAEENPGKIYTIEAMLVNEDLIRLAENFGVLGYKHGYGSEAVYFAKNGRLIPLPKAMEELGSAGMNLSGRKAKDVASEYRVKKKLEKQKQREQALDFHKFRRGMSEEEAANAAMQQPIQREAIDWMGEGQRPTRTPPPQRPDSGPIGFDDTPPWLREFYESTPQASEAFDSAFNDAMSMYHAEGVSPSGIEYELRTAGYQDDVVDEVMRELRDHPAAHPRDYDMAVREQGDEILEQGAVSTIDQGRLNDAHTDYMRMYNEGLPPEVIEERLDAVYGNAVVENLYGRDSGRIEVVQSRRGASPPHPNARRRLTGER